MSPKSSKIAIIGGGHNAILCSIVLAQAGHTVDIYESTERLGGALDVVRSDCGCQINRYANQLRLLDKAAIAIIDHVTECDLTNSLLVPEFQARISIGDTQIVIHSKDTIETIAEKASLFEPVANTERYLRDLQKASSLVEDLWVSPYASRSHFEQRLRGHSPHFVDAFVSGSLTKTADSYFESKIAKMIFVLSQSLITSDPGDEGSAFCLLYQDSANASFAPNYAIPRLGMASLATQFVAAAEQSGVTFFTKCAATSIDVVDTRIKSVRMENGLTIWDYEHYIFGFSPAIVRSLISPVFGEDDYHHLQSYETGGAKVFLTLERNSQNLESIYTYRAPYHCIYPDGDSFAAASKDARHSREFHPAFVEVMIDELAGYSPRCVHHIALSVYAGFYPYNAVKQMRKEESDALVTRDVVRALSSYFGIPGADFRVNSVETSLDFERNLGMFRGDVDHGSFSCGNQFERRGRLSVADEDSLFNYWNCSAGAFPGGLITGRAGISCAYRVMEALRHG